MSATRELLIEKIREFERKLKFEVDQSLRDELNTTLVQLREELDKFPDTISENKVLLKG